MIARELTPEQEVMIDHRLDQAFAFIRDVIDDPVILEEIPDGSQLRFLDVTIGEVVVRLTAYPEAGPSWSWTARITGPARWAAEGRKPVNVLPGATGVTRKGSAAHPAHGHTAEEALAALEEQLRAASQHLEADFGSGRRTA